jgi:hypothetical protein
LISHKIGKGKIINVYAMKVYMWSRGIIPLMLDFGTRCRWVVNLTLPPLPVE